ncbi:hypothetical protein GGI25_006222 [Coemansia spiralis]|uniref:NADH dehydrogenase [ubiquinone] 1 beta subcomplex subunit 11, mitochondrial n=2 Tax=Coemansia TaxID=4863 RepID=A0A9W8G0U3_9FUNG|nr:ESSS subunit of NADH:ubiquinone oxidoreductase-domain-containing protein [Coemansia spiralis]KAJ1987487.1 hypothetical protein EDC05_005801 [Coemansia umbellata]KAJ2619081.1 hypothetical protein GGI26_006108 [Coemansia sp. RSA 1358]KAJ2669225.1 hypothetical protein GGI25_006222 [Coemansia spiralis]
MFSRFAQLSARSSRLANRAIVRGGHGEQKFNEPGGYLFGRKPGEKYEREGWELIWHGGLGIAAVLIAVGQYYRPDTRIRTWAREEAIRQMREEGDILEYKHTDYKA